MFKQEGTDRNDGAGGWDRMRGQTGAAPAQRKSRVAGDRGAGPVPGCYGTAGSQRPA